MNMDTAVAICTLEATYKSSADAAAVETMILRLTEKVQYVFLFVLNQLKFLAITNRIVGSFNYIYCCVTGSYTS